MVRRSTETIDHLDGADTSVPATRTNVTKIEPVVMVDINYPDPTPLATIIRDVEIHSSEDEFPVSTPFTAVAAGPVWAMVRKVHRDS